MKNELLKLFTAEESLTSQEYESIKLSWRLTTAKEDDTREKEFNEWLNKHMINRRAERRLRL